LKKLFSVLTVEEAMSFLASDTTLFQQMQEILEIVESGKNPQHEATPVPDLSDYKIDPLSLL